MFDEDNVDLDKTNDLTQMVYEDVVLNNFNYYMHKNILDVTLLQISHADIIVLG